MEYYYTLFVQTGYENNILKKLMIELDDLLFRPFLPKRERFFRKKGVTKRERELSFRGYIFIESLLEQDLFLQNITPVIKKINGIYKVMDYGSKDSIVMCEQDKKLFKKLYGEENCLLCSLGIIQGNEIIINEGPLVGLEKMIKKIDLHRREAVIELDLWGSTRQVSVALEVIKKNDIYL